MSTPRLRTIPARLPRRIRLAAPAFVIVLIATVAPVPSAAWASPNQDGPPIATSAAGPACPGERPAAGWSLSSSTVDPRNSYHAFVGNGYLAARIPAGGTGYWAGEAKTSSMNSTVTTAPPMSALIGVPKRGCTRAIHRDPGSARSRAYENASRLPAPWIEVPQEKNAKMIISSRKSCTPDGSWPRIEATPPL